MAKTEWTTFSWWKKSRGLAFAISLFIVAFALLLGAYRISFGPEQVASSIAVLALSAFPLLGVFTIAAFTKMQQNVDVKTNRTDVDRARPPRQRDIKR